MTLPVKLYAFGEIASCVGRACLSRDKGGTTCSEIVSCIGSGTDVVQCFRVKCGKTENQFQVDETPIVGVVDRSSDSGSCQITPSFVHCVVMEFLVAD